MTDDHAYDAVSGSARFPGLQSPGFDRLRDEGTLFENAFVTTSLCSPSRATSLTDMYANCSGVPTNQSKQDPDEALPLIFEMLQDAGYNTAFIGKWHMKDTDVPRRGFDYWYSYEGQGTYNNPVMNENGTRSEVEGYTTDILIDKALWWIENNKGKGPFALFLWHKAPHGPFHPAPRHEHLYYDLAISSPVNYDDDFVGKPAWHRRGLAYGKNNKQWKASEGSLYFDGKSLAVMPANLIPQGAFTMGLRLRPDKLDRTQGILFCPNRLTLRCLPSGLLEMEVGGLGRKSTVLTADAPINWGTWCDIEIQYDFQSIRLICDGRTVASASATGLWEDLATVLVLGQETGGEQIWKYQAGMQGAIDSLFFTYGMLAEIH